MVGYYSKTSRSQYILELIVVLLVVVGLGLTFAAAVVTAPTLDRLNTSFTGTYVLAYVAMFSMAGAAVGLGLARLFGPWTRRRVAVGLMVVSIVYIPSQAVNVLLEIGSKLAESHQPVEWQAATLIEGLCSVEFPSSPEYTMLDKEHEVGTILDHRYEATFRAMVFYVHASRFPSGVLPSEPDLSFFESIIDQTATRVDGRVTSRNPSPDPKLPSYDATLTRADGQVRIVLRVTENTLIQMLAQYSGVGESPAEVERFFESFEGRPQPDIGG